MEGQKTPQVLSGSEWQECHFDGISINGETGEKGISIDGLFH